MVIHLLQSSTSFPSDISVCVCLTSVNHISSILFWGFFFVVVLFVCLVISEFDFQM